MKKLILIFACLFVFSSQNTNAQDIFGRARIPDSTFLDARDFNVGDYLQVDTVNGQKVFVGDTVSSSGGADIGYTEFCARITQSSTSAPTVTVLKNTTGATVSNETYNGVGWYEIAFPSDVFSLTKTTKKTEILAYSDEGIDIQGYVSISNSLSSIFIATTLTDLTPTDGLLTSTVNYILEIRTYP